MGESPTVTDAHVVLGRIAEDQLVGGELRIDPARAERALTQFGNPVDVAVAIVRIANSNMERAIRAVSVERGEDPREFPLVAFGGCGGLHACEIAEELGIRTVIVPRMAGALSALGMLLADRTRDYSTGALGASDYETRFGRMERQARKDMRGARVQRFADIRYAGQSYELTIPVARDAPLRQWSARFHEEHRRVYGYSDPRRGTQIVTLRLRATIAVKRPALRVKPRPAKPEFAKRRVWIAGAWRNTAGTHAPALVIDYGSTTLVPPGWKIHLDRAGSLIMTLNS
jgi:N-methylhydantoinase A